MKRQVLSICLLFIAVVVAIQPSLAFHFCGGRLDSVNFFSGEVKKCACGMEGAEFPAADVVGFTVPVKPCCSSNVVTIATDDFQSAQETLVVCASQIPAPVVFLVAHLLPVGEPDASFILQHIYPPGGLPKYSADILALNCILRI